MSRRVLLIIASLLCCRCTAPSSTTRAVALPHVRTPADARNIPANAGVTAINSKFAGYGVYLQRLVDAVQQEWDGLVASSKQYPPVGSFVIVRFLIDSTGSIPRIIEVENHSSELGAQLCVSAIANVAPFGEWTAEMKSNLKARGEELAFTFYYQ